MYLKEIGRANVYSFVPHYGASFVTFHAPRIFRWILGFLFLENLRSPDLLWLKIKYGCLSASFPVVEHRYVYEVCFYKQDILHILCNSTAAVFYALHSIIISKIITNSRKNLKWPCDISKQQ
jgi:hypothetical protein